MWLVMAGMWLGARLPWALQRRLGALIGRALLRLVPDRREAARTNLALCLPELDESQRETLLRHSFEDLGIGMFEFARAWWGSIAPMRRDVSIEGLDKLLALQAQGRGVLLISGHFMTLETCGRLLCDHVALAGMYRRHRNAVFEWAVKRGRLRYASAMYTNDEIRPVVRLLKRGGFLWYAPDQDMRGKDTVFAPFFGVAASTITATHALARMTGAAVIGFFHRRRDDGFGYEMRVEAPLADFPSTDATADAARINALIERMVREAPDEYLWVHRRFHRRPPGEARIY